MYKFHIVLGKTKSLKSSLQFTEVLVTFVIYKRMEKSEFHVLIKQYF